MGYYCPAGTTDPYENPCPKGTYNPVNQSDGAEDCLDCPPGQYCQSKSAYIMLRSSQFSPLQVVLAENLLVLTIISILKYQNCDSPLQCIKSQDID